MRSRSSATIEAPPADASGPHDQRWRVLRPAALASDHLPRPSLTWLELVGRGLDGIVAKRLDQAYQPGRRAMQKYKLWHTVDCVVGGVYLEPGGKQVQSVLLGLYDDDGKLHYVGRSTLHANAAALSEKLTPFIGGEGFSGRSRPEEPLERAGTQVVPLRPELVVAASADHITDRHFRHGARSCAGAPTRTRTPAPWIRSNRGMPVSSEERPSSRL